MPNRLAQETSPYLLQHQENPVEWRPWGEEALASARADEKPIFLSIGYSACHWCHVMERESFENEAIAAYLNEHFISIKVDREERPDLDQIYMNAVQLMTGHGGWPMSVFLTPDLKPFYGGTYWPPEPSRGMPGFLQVLHAVREAWIERREQAMERSEQLTAALARIGESTRSEEPLTLDLLRQAVATLERNFDYQHGGFGSAPKFPHPMDLELLLRAWRRWPRPQYLQMATITLDRMAAGGIYDHLAGGFARYSVDERWLVPHFEKMLYDNALLTSVYLDAFTITANTHYARIARETCDYVLEYLTDPAGPFHSTEDADSEGVEGKFYVWTPAEIKALLPEDEAELFCYAYDVTVGGNFEGQSILNLPKTVAQAAKLRNLDPAELESRLSQSRAILLAARNERVRPAKDDKALAAWNGLMIHALARAAAVLDEPRYAQAAEKAADFILREFRDDQGRLLHTWRAGQAKQLAFLDDYAALANALASLYEAGGDSRWIHEAVGLLEVVLTKFRDEEGAFFYTGADHETLITRNRDLHDSSVPSGNALAATALARVGKLTGRTDLLDAARHTLEAARQVMEQTPQAAGQMLIALDLLLGPTPEIVLTADLSQSDERGLLTALHRTYLPNRVVAVAEASPAEEMAPLLTGKVRPEQPAAFVCRDFHCEQPVVGAESILDLWEQLARDAIEDEAPSS